MKIVYWILLALVTIFVLCIYHYPDVLPVFSHPEHAVYLSQNSYFDPWDVNIYVSSIRYGQHGGVFLSNLYTSSPNTPVLVFTVETLLGVLSPHSDPFLLFHMATIIFGASLIFGVYHSINSLGFSQAKSLLLTMAITLGGGVGYLSFLQAADSSQSSFSFYSTFQKPHEALAMLGYILSLTFFYHLCVEKKISYFKFSGLLFSLCLAVFIYPYIIISFTLSTALFLLISFEDRIPILLKTFASVYILGGIVSLISFSQFFINPTFWGIGTNLFINIFSVFWGFGILVPLFIWYIFWLPKNKLGIFLSITCIITFFLGVLPIGPGKIFFRGSFFPLTIVAFMAIESYLVKNPEINRYFIYAMFLILNIATSLYIFDVRIGSALAFTPWVYTTENEYSVLTFLKNHTKPGSGVFTYYRLSNQIPAFTDNTVFYGHNRLTPDGDEKANQAVTFITGAGSREEKKNFLMANHISYIVWGKEEELLYEKNKNSDNSIKALLQNMKTVYTNNDFTIYKID